MSRTILYAEVPGFYAEVERAADPTLGARPVIVGGDPRKKGLVQAATADAVGVHVGMPVLQALERCPRARALRTRMPFYREASMRLRACLRRVLDALEPEGLDAVFAEIGDRSESPEALAASLRERARTELALPLRIGVAPVRVLAQVAARQAGEAGLRCIRPGEEAAFLAPLSPGAIPFLGPNAELRLAQAGARTVGDALALGDEPLEDLLGGRARELRALAAGRGDDRVRAARSPQSLGQETTLETPAVGDEAVRAELARLASGLEAMLRVQGLGARRITLKLRFDDERTLTRSRTLVRSVSQRQEIEAEAAELLARADVGSRPVRLVGLLLARLGRSRRDGRQLELFRPAG